MAPHNPLSKVRQLVIDEESCSFFDPVFAELRARGLDTDDLRAIIQTELGETHFKKSEPTRRHYPTTVSDYYSIWVDDCADWMFLKLLVSDADILVVTSFKKDIDR
ncbi:type II toxin-antitoxin system MqsR family toxin [Methylobacterium sp. 37f]|uniref:type II toxin-antitoxin system MqsR family toxin n=1 Tax=Methylobacterium sp. 37f TaxID=2817058 RepID=UPI001FFC791D|nr:type II toxin-antitoxin system MqsR family toxin [Methylobacterium sp. 37f]MCK2056802.1 type II toxin-antitoxin system MqsR family toxin [Methylobacterium sp. 37f]